MTLRPRYGAHWRHGAGCGSRSRDRQAPWLPAFCSSRCRCRCTRSGNMAHGGRPCCRLIPEKAQPPKVFFQLVSVFAGAALRVQVLDAENDPPAPALGAQPCKEAAREIARWSRPLGLGANRPTTALTGPASTPRPSAGRWGCCNTLPRPLPCTRRRRSLPSPWRSAWPAGPDRCPP